MSDQYFKLSYYTNSVVSSSMASDGPLVEYVYDGDAILAFARAYSINYGSPHARYLLHGCGDDSLYIDEDLVEAAIWYLRFCGFFVTDLAEEKKGDAEAWLGKSAN